MLVLAKEEAELAKFTDFRADIALATPTAWSWLLSRSRLSLPDAVPSSQAVGLHKSMAKIPR